MSSSIPTWLQEHCVRLSTNDADLVNLNLNIRRLDSDAMEVLSQALQNNRTLEILNLTSSFMNSPEALVPLSTLVVPQQHSCLRILHLSYNNLTDVAGLGRALRTNTSLVELHLDYNQIGDASAVSLANGIQHHPSLQLLSLNSNNIGDKGASAFGEMIGSSYTSPLRRLCLASNAIGKTGGTALYRGLQSNVSIQEIRIDKNESVPMELVQRIRLFTEANTNGRYLLKQDSNNVPIGLWAHVLAHVRDNPCMIYFFLTNKPDLVSSTTK